MAVETSNEQPEEIPVFDMDDMSWDQAENLYLCESELRKAQTTGDPDAVRRGFAGMRVCLAGLIVSIPRSWLIKRAPEVLDWNDTASFGFLRADKFMKLFAAAVTAQNPEEIAKN